MSRRDAVSSSSHDAHDEHDGRRFPVPQPVETVVTKDMLVNAMAAASDDPSAMPQALLCYVGY